MIKLNLSKYPPFNYYQPKMPLISCSLSNEQLTSAISSTSTASNTTNTSDDLETLWLYLSTATLSIHTDIVSFDIPNIVILSDEPEQIADTKKRLTDFLNSTTPYILLKNTRNSLTIKHTSGFSYSFENYYLDDYGSDDSKVLYTFHGHDTICQIIKEILAYIEKAMALMKT